MNQEKIGKFIATLRKENNLTQKELAEKLGITDRAISHWENGRCLPDVSLFEDLSNILNITVNELISGERISSDKLIKKSDENIINTLKVNKKKNKKTKLIIFILSLIIIVLSIFFFEKYKSFYKKIDLFNINVQLKDNYKLTKELTIDKRNIYYYGIDLVFLCDNKDNCYQLKQALNNKQITLNEINKYLEKQVEYKNFQVFRMYDGGTTIYKKSDMIIIFCNTIAKNKDIYIGNNQLLDTLNGNYCGHEENETKSFKRTYKVLNTTYYDDIFNYVTLIQNNGEEEKVLINNSYLLVPGHTYEFSFVTFLEYDDNIKNIFNNSTLLSVSETNKKLKEQINEKIIINKN